MRGAPGSSRPPGRPPQCCGIRCSGTDCPPARAGCPPPSDLGFSVRQGRHGHHHAGSAVAALQPVVLLKSLLHGMHPPVCVGQSLDRRHIGSLGLCRQDRAGLHGFPVQQYGAGPARRGVASDIRTGQAGLIAEIVDEQRTRLDLVGLDRPVDIDGDPHVSSFRPWHLEWRAIPASVSWACRHARLPGARRRHRPRCAQRE